MGVFPYALAAFSSLIAFVSVLARLSDRRTFAWLLLPLLGGAGFSLALIYLAMQGQANTLIMLWLDALKNTLWLMALAAFSAPGFSLFRIHLAPRFMRGLGVVALLAFALITLIVGAGAFVGIGKLHSQIVVISLLVMALVGGLFVEQIYRNSPSNRRWTIKFMCFSVGGMFAFSFYVYSNALLFNRIDGFLWASQGFVLTLVAPLYSVSLLRLKAKKSQFSLSRRMAFYTSSLLLGGAYLVVLALGGYYVRLYGGEWGRVVQAVLIFGGSVGLVFILSSGHMRAYLRVFLSKHFFSYQYDYREEWTRFARIMADDSQNLTIEQKVIESIASIVDAPAGLLWVTNDHGKFELAAKWNMPIPETNADILESDFTRIMLNRNWLIVLGERIVIDGESLELPRAISAVEQGWLLIPLKTDNKQLGMVLLRKPLAPRKIDWEERDLLKVVASQAAIHMHQALVSRALGEARQFEAYNRMSAFVVHDLKNVVAQLSLLQTNAEKHKHNPAFIDDAFITVGSAVDRMNKTLGQLRQRMQKSSVRSFAIQQMLEKVVSQRARQKPIPSLVIHAEGLNVVADEEQLANVFNHLIQNGQEACDDEGLVIVTLQQQADNAKVCVRDTGVGMDESFIRDKLFVPFATTKGNAGMGIGAYQARSIVKSIGGRIEVSSSPGEGTEFVVFIPLAQEEHQM